MTTYSYLRVVPPCVAALSGEAEGGSGERGGEGWWKAVLPLQNAPSSTGTGPNLKMTAKTRTWSNLKKDWRTKRKKWAACETKRTKRKEILANLFQTV